jgi:hypothetical protein
MSNMILIVEFLAGTDLKDALQDAKEKAKLFDVALICFDFNGINFCVSKMTDIEEKISMYNDAICRGNES